MTDDSQSVAVAIKQGRRLLVEGRYKENFEFLKEAVQRFPDDPEIRLLWATSLMADHREDVAEQATKAIELDPDEPIRLTRAAGLLFDLGEIEAARSYATRAAELAPADFLFMPELTHLAGLLGAVDGDDDPAEEALRLAVEFEPDREAFVRGLADFLTSRNRTKEAVEVIDQALKVSKEKEKLENLREEIVDRTSLNGS